MRWAMSIPQSRCLDAKGRYSIQQELRLGHNMALQGLAAVGSPHDSGSPEQGTWQTGSQQTYGHHNQKPATVTCNSSRDPYPPSPPGRRPEVVLVRFIIALCFVHWPCAAAPPLFLFSGPRRAHPNWTVFVSGSPCAPSAPSSLAYPCTYPPQALASTRVYKGPFNARCYLLRPGTCGSSSQTSTAERSCLTRHRK